MQIKDIVKILNKNIPITDTWGGGEPYGPQYIKDFNVVVNKILYCVTATLEVVKYFNDNKYDLLVSHHPYAKSGISQLIYHTALDCCQNGLNDMWRDALGLKDAKHFDRNLGWVGSVDPISFDSLRAKIKDFIGHDPIGHLETNGEPITSIVICTGLGGLVFREAEMTKADCYVTGELSFAEKGRFKSIIEVGHTLTEFIGVRFLRKLLPDIQIDVAPLELDYFGVETSIGKYAKKSNTPNDFNMPIDFNMPTDFNESEINEIEELDFDELDKYSKSYDFVR